MLGSPDAPSRILALGAHPDDIEFGCAGVLLAEAERGAHLFWAVATRGEAASNGTPELRTREAEQAAQLCGAQLRWLDLGPDAGLEDTSAGRLALAALIRELRPDLLLTPTLVADQHPDHWALARMTQAAVRLARYGGLAPLRELPAHQVRAVLTYGVTGAARPASGGELLFEVSGVVERWRQAMACHRSQLATRDYLEYQLELARLAGRECGVGYAVPLYPLQGVVLGGLSSVTGARHRF